MGVCWLLEVVLGVVWVLGDFYPLAHLGGEADLLSRRKKSPSTPQIPITQAPSNALP